MTIEKIEMIAAMTGVGIGLCMFYLLWLYWVLTSTRAPEKPTEDLEILKVLVVTTAHVPRDVYGGVVGGASVMSRPEGDLLFVSPEEEEREDWERRHKNLEQLTQIARDNDCSYLMFDRDGPVVKGVSTYEW
jgi:hypothetical protein